MKEEGTFNIDDNTIIFTSKTGKTRKELIHSFDNGKDDIIINQQLFKKIS